MGVAMRAQALNCSSQRRTNSFSLCDLTNNAMSCLAAPVDLAPAVLLQARAIAN
jgi:hypothetical protein